jgi:hypothetical protein
MAEIVRRRSWGGVLPLGRHVSISGSRSIHAPSVSIAPSSFQEEQNARHHKQFKLEQALGLASIAQDVTPELARATVASVEVLGAFHASPAVKAALRDRIR